MDRRSKIQDFLGEKLTGQQVKELLEWMHSPEGEAYLSTEIDQAWAEEIQQEGHDTLDAEALWQKVRADSGSYPRPVVLRSADKAGKVIPIWLKVACCTVILASFAWLLLPSYQPTAPPASTAADIEKTVTKYNPPGQKTKVHLSDGSTVILNSDSRIEYPADFINNRTIALDGEAFFTVKKDTVNPFSVVARGIVTEALGTSFNVSTFVKDKNVKVTLISGQVRLNTSGRENHLILNPGEESIVSETTQEFHKNRVDATKSILWTDGILTFENTPIMQVIDLLERWYGVKIKVNGTITPTLCSGTFQNERLDNVLEVLGSSVGFVYKLNGKNVMINF